MLVFLLWVTLGTGVAFCFNIQALGYALSFSLASAVLHFDPYIRQHSHAIFLYVTLTV